MNVLFLDIDGVVNCAKTFQRHRGFIGIDPYMAFLVGNMVDDLDLKVVLSSSWKNAKEGQEEVRRQVCDFIDCTPSLLGDTIRGDEIKTWLDKHPEVEKYAILDDDSDMLPEQFPNFFKCSWEEGITPEIIKRVRKHFGE